MRRSRLIGKDLRRLAGLILVVASSVLPVASAQQVTGVRLGQTRTYAFLVGCGEYDKRELRPLEFTKKDVQDFHKVLVDSGVPKENMVLMHDDQPRNLIPESRKIREQLDLLLARVDKKSNLIVALSGHGIQFDSKGTNYFCPLDARLEETSTLIPLDEIFKQIEACPAERKLLLVDACRNDPQSSLAKSRAVVDLKTLSRPQEESVPQGIVALFSCSAGQQSYEDPKLKHGVFFSQLLQGWKGAADTNKDSTVTLDELLSYTKHKTEEFAHLELNSKQIPHLKGDFSGTWILKELPLPPPTPLLPKGPGGYWNIAEGRNFDGSVYHGNLDIHMLPSGLAQLTWYDSHGKASQNGLGFVRDGHLLAGFSFGPGFGINLYKIGKDGTLTATWTHSKDGGKIFSEVAYGTPGKLEGNYTMRGDANDGSNGAYSGSMTINRYGQTYYVGWNVNGTTKFYGIGLVQGDYLAVGWSTAEKGFGVVDYALQGDGAQGRWTVFGTDKLSTELLQRAAQ